MSIAVEKRQLNHVAHFFRLCMNAAFRSICAPIAGADVALLGWKHCLVYQSAGDRRNIGTDQIVAHKSDKKSK